MHVEGSSDHCVLTLVLIGLIVGLRNAKIAITWTIQSGWNAMISKVETNYWTSKELVPHLLLSALNKVHLHEQSNRAYYY